MNELHQPFFGGTSKGRRDGLAATLSFNPVQFDPWQQMFLFSVFSRLTGKKMKSTANISVSSVAMSNDMRAILFVPGGDILAFEDALTRSHVPDNLTPNTNTSVEKAKKEQGQMRWVPSFKPSSQVVATFFVHSEPKLTPASQPT